VLHARLRADLWPFVLVRVHLRAALVERFVENVFRLFCPFDAIRQSRKTIMAPTTTSTGTN
jgi:hypothetical protein